MQLCGSRPGQVKNPMTNTTEEIDECALMPQICNHGKCINTPGSFRCICDIGYIYDEFSHQCIGKRFFIWDLNFYKCNKGQNYISEILIICKKLNWKQTTTLSNCLTKLHCEYPEPIELCIFN